MPYSFGELLAVLATSSAIVRPLGFYNPKESAVAVYPELPIEQCKAKPRFSDFDSECCGQDEQWHAHFPCVGSPEINTVLGIYQSDGEHLIGFASIPGHGDFDRAILKSTNDFAKIPEFRPDELPGDDSILAQLGTTPLLTEVFIGATTRGGSSYVEVSFPSQEFCVYGVFAEVPTGAAKISITTSPAKSHLEDLANLWRDQKDVSGRYLSGFVFLTKDLASGLDGVPVIDHEKLRVSATSFRLVTEWVTPKAFDWQENAVLSMARYTAAPSPELAVEAASWLKSAQQQSWVELHFPDLEEVEAKFFQTREAISQSRNFEEESCSDCGEPFEFDSDRFCGICGTPRGGHR